MVRPILVEGLHLKVFPVLEGERFQSENNGQQLYLDSYPLGDCWSDSDWKKIDVASKFEYTWAGGKLSGFVASVNWQEPSVELGGVVFQGPEHLLKKSSLRPYGSYTILSYEVADVKPLWLFPGEVQVPWKTYESILSYLAGWEPFRPLTLSELWWCVKHATSTFLTFSLENLARSLSVEGNFALPCELRRVHDALRLARDLKTYGWPLEEEQEEEGEDLLSLWFDLSTGKRIWLKPDSLLEDRLGLACAWFTRRELEQTVESVALKLLFPVREPFFSLSGQVFESTSGPA